MDAPKHKTSDLRDWDEIFGNLRWQRRSLQPKPGERAETTTAAAATAAAEPGLAETADTAAAEALAATGSFTTEERRSCSCRADIILPGNREAAFREPGNVFPGTHES